MKRLFSLLFMMVIVSMSIMAAPRSRSQAESIARNWTKQLGINADINSRRLVQGAGSDTAPYYVFNHGGNNGWTIVAGDDRMDEVIGYSDQGNFEMEQLPAPVQEMLQALTNHVKNLDNLTTVPEREVRRAPSESDCMGPYITTRWDQYNPYYLLTPTSSGTHTATCCVATAFAQILYYLYWTQGQIESSTFENSIPAYTASSGLSGSAVSGPRTYEWSKMIADYAEGYTDEQATAVATLMRDIGTCIQVNYAVSVSTTNSRRVSERCSTYFGLQEGSTYTYSSSMGASTWKTAVIKELQNYRPVMVASNDHAYICDGYDGNGLYHFNFGYSGRGDGWYTFSAMNGYGTATWGYTTGLKLRAQDSDITRLSDICKTARAHAALTPVGTEGGNYRQDLYDALMALVEQGEAAVANDCADMTATTINDLVNEISKAIVALTTIRTPYLTGTYYIKTYTNYSDGKTKAMYANGTGVNWGTISEGNDNYKWYLEYNPETNAYIMYNVGTGGHFTSISTSTQAKLSTTKTVEVEVKPLAQVTRNEQKVYACTIRPMVTGYNTGYNYFCHQNGHNNGSGTGSTVVGWEPYSDANQWYFEAIDVNPEPTSYFEADTLTLEIGQTATNKLTTNSSGRVQYASSNSAVVTVNPNGTVTAVDAGTATITATIAKTDDYSSQRISYTVIVPEDAAIREKLDVLIAQAEGLYTDEDLAAARERNTDTVGEGLITAASQITSPYTETSEGKIDYLLDGNASTFWHSAWSAGSVASGTHYFEVALNEALTSDVLLSMTRRASATNDHPTQFEVYCSTDGTNYDSDKIVLDFEYETAGETVTTLFRPVDECQKMKFVCTATTTGRGYFHMGEFQLYRYIKAVPNEADQALIDLAEALANALASNPASQQAVDQLQQAIDAYLPYTDAIGEISITTEQVHKLIRQGRIVIVRGNEQYGVDGTRIK